VVAEKDHGKRFTATFRAGVILRMRRDNSILITANMQSGTGFPSSHQLKFYVASKSRLKLAARAVLSADQHPLTGQRRLLVLFLFGR